ncbi:sulfatase-like hydrolase/transferase [Paraglaciecola aquimarina]|uniref:Sulfatase-like hydrolase/transferase n=1 Tax=Paraglaciecola aquimarina TaxID=1235557 RepID=A0ABU3SVH2_9ALTE|nr:sulfatase-like hydrolase/transferase [Paraglaciecola aquimarina]MDU0354007.1 sulfatase-like hydrolase/transferase [Paraglaciecola aquimarina]
MALFNNTYLSVGFSSLCCCALLIPFFTIAKSQPSQPNIVVFYVDDLGWGDLSSYGATQVNTPNVDALASNGIRFTDAHSSAATCTPSRYSLLTGEHAFRKKSKFLREMRL